MAPEEVRKIEHFLGIHAGFACVLPVADKLYGHSGTVVEHKMFVKWLCAGNEVEMLFHRQFKPLDLTKPYLMENLLSQISCFTTTKRLSATGKVHKAI